MNNMIRRGRSVSVRGGAAPPAWGERAPGRGAAGGAPGGAAPLRHWGARAFARRAADPRKVRQGADRNAPGASRRSISLACKGEGKRGKGDARRPKIEVTGRHSVAYPPSPGLDPG